MMTKSQKIIFCIVSAIAGLLFVGAIYYYYKVQARKQVFEQEAIKHKKENNVMEQKIDSIYKNFTSVDLKMVDAKGFVHTIEYYENYERPGYKSVLNISLAFDKKGNIVDIKTTYRDSEKLYTATYERNGNGQIESIVVRTSYTNAVNESYKGYFVRNLSYDSDGHVCRIVIDDQSEGGKGDEYINEDTKFYDYQENKGFMARKSEDENGFGKFSTKGKYNDVKNDSIGNWITRKGSMTALATYMDGEPTSSTHEIKDSRKITYYDKDEIDFTPFLK